MNRQMRRKERELSAENVKKVFAKGNHGTLAVNGDDGYPYAVPVNYVYEDGKIYIHSAKHGYKTDAIKKSNKVCFSAIINSKIEQSKFTAAFQSVIAFGKITVVEDDEEKHHVLKQFIYKMAPDFVEEGMKFVKAGIGKTELLRIDVEEMKGKENMAEVFDV